MAGSGLVSYMLSDKQEAGLGDQIGRDAGVTRQTVAHLQTLAIEHGKRLSEIERHVRDIKFGVVTLMMAVAWIAAHQIWRG